jgi:hypothetical protein
MVNVESVGIALDPPAVVSSFVMQTGVFFHGGENPIIAFPLFSLTCPTILPLVKASPSKPNENWPFFGNVLLT